MNERCACASGFTMIEVLVALIVLSVGILGVVGGHSVCARAASRNQRWDRAVEIAQRELELASASSGAESEPTTGVDGQFSWSLTTEDLPRNLARVSVSVNWMQFGQPQTFKLTRIIPPRTTAS